MKKAIVLFIISLFFNQDIGAQELKLRLPIGHTGKVYSAVFSNDEKIVLTASADYTAKLWDVALNSVLKELKGHTGIVISAFFSPDGKKIVTASYDSTARIWDARSGNLLLKLRHNNWVTSAVFSSDGNKVLTTVYSMYGSMRISMACLWDASSGDSIHELKLNGYDASSAIFSPDGKSVLTSGDTARLWDVTSGKVVRWLPNEGFVSSVAFSSDGKMITTAGGHTMRLWDATSGTSNKEFQYSYEFNSATFGFDGKTIMTTSRDEAVIIWDVKSGTSFRKLQLNQNKFVSPSLSPDEEGYISFKSIEFSVVHSSVEIFEHRVIFSPSGKTIVTSFSDGTIKLWSIDSSKLLKDFKVHTADIYSIVFSRNEEKLLTASADQTSVLLDISSDNTMKQFKGHTVWVNSAGFSQGGKTAVLACKDGAARVWDVVNGKVLKVLRGHKANVSSATFSPDGETILTTSYDGTAKLWHTDSLDFINELRIHSQGPMFPDKIYSAAFSPDGEKILAVSQDNKGWLLDAGYLNVLLELKGEIDHASSVAFSANGKKILTVSPYNSVKLWDAVYGSLLTIFDSVATAAFSANGKKILTAFRDGRVNIRSTALGISLKEFRLRDGILSAVFSPDGKKILIVYEDGTMELCNALSGDILIQLKSTGYITSAVFSPDGKNILSTSGDGTIKLWDVESAKPRYEAVIMDSTDYLILVPLGYYKCSPDVAKKLYYTKDDSTFFSFEQLDVRYNRPDRVLQLLGSDDTSLISAYRKAYEKRIKKLNIDTSTFQPGFSVPEADFSGRSSIKYEQFKKDLTLHIRGIDSIFLLDNYNVWVNEAPVFGLKGKNIRWRGKKSFDTTILVTLCQGENRIETSVINVNGIASYRSPLFVRYTPPQPVQEKTYFVGIGIDQFTDNSYNLQWSVKDVRDLAGHLRQKYGASISMDTLFNEKVTADNVKALKKKLEQSGVDDKVVVAYSGHGLLNKDYDYYLSTYNINFENPEQNGLPYDVLEDILDSIPARKKLMLVDACHSGEVDKEEMARYLQVQKTLDARGVTRGVVIVNTDSSRVGTKSSFELMQELFVNVGKSTGATVISASAGTQFALERGDLKNGVFTFSILEYMKQNAKTTVSGLKRYVNQRVKELTEGMQVPTNRSETNQFDWQVW